jgi:hypothetical protein
MKEISTKVIDLSMNKSGMFTFFKVIKPVNKINLALAAWRTGHRNPLGNRRPGFGCKVFMENLTMLL